MTEPIILDETKDQTRRLVQLEATHQIDDEGALSQLYLASLTLDGAKLGSISNAGSPTSFWLDATAADAFCTAWTKFKADQEANKKAEEERKNTLIADAYAIARRHPEISIKAGRGYWNVSIPSRGYDFVSPAYYPDNLLEQVKCCLAVLTGREEDTKATA